MIQDSALRRTIGRRDRVKENDLLVWREASSNMALEQNRGCRAQRHDVCRGMTAVVAGMIVCILHVAGIVANIMVFICFNDMSVPCPHRPVTDGAENEPDHEKAP